MHISLEGELECLFIINLNNIFGTSRDSHLHNSVCEKSNKNFLGISNDNSKYLCKFHFEFYHVFNRNLRRIFVVKGRCVVIT